MRRNLVLALAGVLVVFAIRFGLQSVRLKHSRAMQSVAREKAVERGELPALPPEVEAKLAAEAGEEARPAEYRFSVSFAGRPCPVDPNHVHDLSEDVRPGDIPYTGPYEILTESGAVYAEGMAPPDGRPVSLEALPPGKYRLRVSVPGTTVTLPIAIYQGSSFHRRVVVPHNCTMRGIRR
jgi:hypothetical protein